MLKNINLENVGILIIAVVFTGVLGYGLITCDDHAVVNQQRRDARRAAQVEECRGLCNGNVRRFVISGLVGEPVCECYQTQGDEE